jgi:catechol 2,3-dioxygenase-like lactoylglutathione lyase family enzyme
MDTGIEQLLEAYDARRISRRKLLAVLSGLLIPLRAAGSEPAIGAIRQLNHVTIFVRNVDKAAAFYQELFGMPLLTRQVPGLNLSTGTGFLGIYPAPGRGTGIDHLCFGMDNFNADAVLTKLRSRGVNARIRLRGDTKELHFTDPDNVHVQLQDVSYNGGVGPLGNQTP